jgi:hypothetical protein
MMKNFSIRYPVLFLAMIIMSVATPLAADDAAKEKAEPVVLDVYKSPTCGCCSVWIDHLEERGFLAKVHHPSDLNKVKREYGVPARYQSCHTAVSKDGYIFEGHIPAYIIEKFLDEKPADAIGLTVPGMPVGSPGMESGDNFMPYQVLLIKASGTPEVYTEVRTREEQYRN